MEDFLLNEDGTRLVLEGTGFLLLEQQVVQSFLMQLPLQYVTARRMGIAPKIRTTDIRYSYSQNTYDDMGPYDTSDTYDGTGTTQLLPGSAEHYRQIVRASPTIRSMTTANRYNTAVYDEALPYDTIDSYDGAGVIQAMPGDTIRVGIGKK